MLIQASPIVCICRVAESRKEANASIDLMLERFRRIRSEEAAKNGLVIVAAVYGKLVEGTVWLYCYNDGKG